MFLFSVFTDSTMPSDYSPRLHGESVSDYFRLSGRNMFAFSMISFAAFSKR
jgi:hypothetical protein